LKVWLIGLEGEIKRAWWARAAQQGDARMAHREARPPEAIA